MAKIRRVATPEGARYYGLPIGAPIVADVRVLKGLQAKSLGISEPAGALTPKGGTDSVAPYVPKVKKSSLSGPAKLQVGQKSYDIPKGSAVVRPKDKPNVAYVKTPDGKMHVFNESGEVDPGPVVGKAMAAKFGDDFKGDDKYSFEIAGEGVSSPDSSVDGVDADPDEVSLQDAPAGSLAVGVDGSLVAVKQDDGSWVNETYGVEVSEEDLQDQVDRGRLMVSTPPKPAKKSADAPNKETDFSEGAAEQQQSVAEEVLKETGGVLPQDEQLKSKATISPSHKFIPSDATFVSEPDLSAYPKGSTLYVESSDGNYSFKAVKKNDKQWTITYEDGVALDIDQKNLTTNDGTKFFEAPVEQAPTPDATEILDSLPTLGEGVQTYAQLAKKLNALPVGTTLSRADGKKLIKQDSGAWRGKGETTDYSSFALWTFRDEYYIESAPETNAPETNAPETNAPETNAPEANAPEANAPEANAPEANAPEPQPLPEKELPSKDALSYENGDNITKYAHLRELPTGTTLRYSNGDPQDEDGGYFITKDADGKWWSEDDTDYPLSSEDLADAIIDKNLYMWEMGSGEAAPEGAPEEVQLVPDGLSVSKAQVEEAISALEAHTGFQIAYGLKSAPDNPIASKDNMDAIKQQALSEYPDMKPKQAFLALLKKKAGIADAPEVTPSAAPDTDSAVAGGPQIHFGSLEPKKTGVQGYDGGDFSAADVEQAIEILENYPGKLFKAELNKKGNALGVLNPNDIVGFDKDKLVTKQKFIDLLKTKLESHNKANAPEANAPEANAPEANAPEANAPEANAPEANAPEANAPEANAPEANAPEANAPEASLNADAPGGGQDGDPWATDAPDKTLQRLQEAPIGTVVKADTGEVYTKVAGWGPEPEKGKWQEKGTGFKVYSDKLMEIHPTSLSKVDEGITTEDDTPEISENLKGKNLTVDELNSLPNGSVIVPDGDLTFLLKKDTNGKWKPADENHPSGVKEEGIWTAPVLQGSFGSLVVHDDSPDLDALKGKDLTEAELDSLPVGTQVVPSGSDNWIMLKDSNGKWKSLSWEDDEEAWWTSQVILKDFPSIQLVDSSQPDAGEEADLPLLGSPVWTPDMDEQAFVAVLAKMPVGSKLRHVPNGTIYTKQENDVWTSPSGLKFSPDVMFGGKNNIVVDSYPDDADSLQAAAADLKSAPVGSTVDGMFMGAPTKITKTAGGWHPETADAAQLYSEESMLEYLSPITGLQEGQAPAKQDLWNGAEASQAPAGTALHLPSFNPANNYVYVKDNDGEWRLYNNGTYVMSVAEYEVQAHLKTNKLQPVESPISMDELNGPATGGFDAHAAEYGDVPASFKPSSTAAEAPVGTKVTLYESTWTKISDGKWYHPDGTTLLTDEDLQAAWDKDFAVFDEPVGPNAWDGKDAGSAPIGTEALRVEWDRRLVKTGVNEWRAYGTDDDEYKGSVGNGMVNQYIKAGELVVPGSDAPAPKAPKPNAFDLKKGSVVTVNGQDWTKTSTGSWINPTNEDTLHHWAMQDLIDADGGTLKSEPDVEKKWSDNDVATAPVGTTFFVDNAPDSNPHQWYTEYVKAGPNTWHVYDGTTGAFLNTNTDAQMNEGLYAGTLLDPDELDPITVDKPESAKPLVTIDEAPVGTQFEAFGVTWTKLSGGKWYHSGAPELLDDDALSSAFLHAGPVYPKDAPEVWNGTNLADAPTGQEFIRDLNFGTSDTPDYVRYVKTGPDNWRAYKDSSGAFLMNVSNNTMNELHKDGELKNPNDPDDTKGIEKFTPDGLKVGKYTTSNGKAYMVVKEDGTGIYVNAKGDATNITKAKVNANHKAGMSKYHGVPDVVPTPGKKKPVKKAEDVPDGEYKVGTPGTLSYTVYTAKDGKFTATKQDKELSSYSGSVVGGKSDYYWAKAAPAGAQITPISEPGTVLTKTDSGEWVKASGVPDTFHAQYINSPWHAGDYKIVSHGSSTTTEIPKKKLQTLFEQGKLSDEYGNSITPEGYDGSLQILGGSTTPANLAMAQKSLSQLDPTTATKPEMQTAYQEAGIYFNTSLGEKYIADLYNGATPAELSNEQFHKMVTDLFGKYLDGVELESSSGGAKDFFSYDPLGQPTYPAYATMHYEEYKSSGLSSYIKEMGVNFGDGKTIGQFYTKMSWDDKKAWIEAFKTGDFKHMYELEFAAAKLAGKPHPGMQTHPGSPLNPDTHKISWGPAVPGEKSAGSLPAGDWSSNVNLMSAEEVNNYLIKAHMQYPEYLSLAEQRHWVHNHKSGLQQNVDKYSVMAKNRKDSGASPLSPTPTWTDSVQPAKSYTSLFDTTKYPTVGWNALTSTDYIADQQSNKELQDFIVQWKADNPYAYYGAEQQALTAYFTQKQQEADIAALIPVYTKKPVQKVKASTHTVLQYTDQFGKEYFFKPRGDSQLQRYLAEAEHLGNQFGRAFGFSTSESRLVTLDGNYGQLQANLNGIGDLSHVDLGSLTAQQLGDIGSEHVLDWFLDNDDTKADNAIMLANGRIVGIDKGRAFKHFGAWKGLSGDYSMDSNCSTIYRQMFDDIRSGKISKVQADAAYLKVRATASKMSKVSDQKIRDMLTEGMKNRPSYDVNYYIDGKKVPNNLEGLITAVLDRKNKLPDQFEELWAKVYKDAGIGDLPQPPANSLTEKVAATGLLDSRWHANVLASKASGSSTLTGNSSVIGGTVLSWTEVDKDGTTSLKSSMFVAPKKHDELLDYFMAHATDLSSSQSTVIGFETYDKLSTPIINAAKTINHHAVDGEYNQTKLDEFAEAVTTIESDLAEWTPGLVSNHSYMGDPAYMFSSGTVIPMQYVDQYKMMLDHYAPKVTEIQNALDNKVKTSVIDKFSPVSLSKDAPVYLNAAGDEKYIELPGNKAFHVSAAGTEVVPFGEQQKKDVLAQGFTPTAEPNTPEVTDAVVITKLPFTSDLAATYDPDTKTKKITKDQPTTGASGSEFKAVLPTGEEIYFRDSGQTNTARGQQGRVTYKIADVSDEASIAASTERIHAYLQSIGLDLNDADENAAELVYWREMYGILENRNKGGADNAKYNDAYVKMDKKVKEIGGKSSHFLENLSATMSSDEEVQFWRDLYSEFWPDEVQKLIDTEGYLPKYDHQDLTQPDLPTGQPYWERFDVSVDDLHAQGLSLTHSTGLSDTQTLALFKSGALLSGEERIRQVGKIYTGGGFGQSSALQDQQNGSSHFIYSRIMAEDSVADITFDPRVLLRTRTYSLPSDSYGNLASRKSSSPANPVASIKKFKRSGGNETMSPHAVTLLDSVELWSFNDEAVRQQLLQYLKSNGITTIRGVPIEERIILKSKMKGQAKKVRAMEKAAA